MMLLRRALGKTTIVHRANVIDGILQIFSNAKNSIDVCGNSKFPLKLFSYDSVKKFREKTASQNVNLRQRYIFEITKENVHYCKDLTSTANNELHHMSDIEANFAVNEIEYLGSITLQDVHQQAIYSNLREVVEQQRSIFETLWNKSIPAVDIIAEIEKGVDPQFLEVISDRQKATEIYLQLAKSVEEEGLFLLADSKAMLRADRLGVIDRLIEASTQRGATIKIICPLSQVNLEIVKKISEKAPAIRVLNGGSSHSGLFIVDNSRFLRFELKDPKAEEFSDAIGFITYSNSKVTVGSSRSFFELIWNEHVQYEKIREYERQKEADRLKDEFLNVAAHELRTPIQPILSLSEILRSKIGDSEDGEFLEIINRNAKRLQQLTQNILDVTRIESESLTLHKERINIHDVIAQAVRNHRAEFEKAGGDLKLLYDPSDKQAIMLDADRIRVIQVVSHLLGNAIKFSKNGVISIAVAVDKKHENIEKVIVSVKDSGPGIDPEIFPRLFSRFISKSFSGTGLGLFISKSIVEAHGGNMWAENSNNNNTRGATFHFTLPILTQ
jgi:two-component system sensor histidine kinase VicK